MADLRLAGTALKVVRQLATSGATRGTLWAVTSRDFFVSELMALGADQRRPLAETPCPVAGAAPRQWADAGLGAPTSTACTSAALTAAYVAGSTDPVAVLERIRGRVQSKDFGPSTHSPFVCTDLDVASGAAKASAARYKAGSPLGPLDGVPVAIKDEVDMVGLITRGGTVYLERVATVDAWVIQRLRAAGAVLVAKAHVPEWGMNPLGFNELYDMPRNAWSAARGAGGSSTGSAVSVALGLVPVALGSDGGGSIRIPASLNGVFGLKPTWQRIGRTGDIWGSGSMPHLGPIGASTSDLVELLAATAARDPGDAGTWLQTDLPPAIDAWRAALGRGVKGCRIGMIRGEWEDAPAALAAPMRAALAALEKEGAKLVEVEIPLARLCGGIGALSIAPEAMANINDDVAVHGARMTEEIRMIHGLMGQISGREYLLVQRTRAALRHQVADALRRCDVLALPSTGAPPAPYALSEGRTPLMDSTTTARMTRYAFLGNLTGLPAGSAPVGLVDGLPVGLQIIGDAWDEASVLAVMAHVERLQVGAIGRSPGWRSLL